MVTPMNQDDIIPHCAEIATFKQESPTIFTLGLRFLDREKQKQFTFTPGQFNMLYQFGVGGVAISIVSDPDKKKYIHHTIRAVGRVTHALQQLKKGDQLGIRGPYGNGWPLQQALGKDIVVVTGGLGCAPTVSVINYVLARREQYGSLKILQGVKHSDDFIFRKQYAAWRKSANTEIYIAADHAQRGWRWGVGFVTDMIQQLTFEPNNTLVMMCGPELMMHSAILAFANKQISEDHIYLSMERNMECGIGHCGHCQYGGLFICKDGPVFAYPTIKSLFKEKGF